MKNVCLLLVSYLLVGLAIAQNGYDKVYPSNTEVVIPIHKNDFNNGNKCPERKLVVIRK